MSVLDGFLQAAATLGKQPRLSSESNSARRYHLLLQCDGTSKLHTLRYTSHYTQNTRCNIRKDKGESAGKIERNAMC